MVVFGEWAQVESVELVNDGSGLAFGIVGGRSSGVVVKTILPGGVADRDGRLRSGDQLLRIGRVSAVGMCARQAAAVLRLCGARVRLLVARPADAAQSLGASNAPIVASRMLADPDELEAHLVARGYTTPATPPGDAGDGEAGDGADAGDDGDDSTRTARPHETVYIEEHQMMRPVTSIVAVVPNRAISALPAVQFTSSSQTSASFVPSLPLDMALQGHQPETESYEVQLNKDSVYGLGITVAGYVCEQEELSGIFVKSISEGSSADLCGKINVNDRIVEVDGTPLNGVTNHRAVGLLRDARGPSVRLRALRYLRGAGYERLQRALAAQERRAGPPSPSVTSLPKYSFSVYEESTVIDTEPDSEVAQHPPTPASPSSEVEIVLGAPDDPLGEQRLREIQDKWREILDNEYDWPGHGDGYDIVAGIIVKERDGGLGISLEGTVRVEHGQEVHARHYIRAVAPSGPVARSGLHKPGDELLEVNGTRLLGVHHVDVVGKLRSLPSQVLLVCARRHSRPGIIDTAQERSAFDTRNILGGSLQNLLMPPQRLIKAKSESSIGSLCSANTTIAAVNSEFLSETPDKNKSRSLETFSGLAMWSDQIEHIDLQKEDRGLGFSILDYLDPSEPGSTVIVVRSVVNGGAAALDGRLAPGDRLVSVNGQDVSKEPLAVAVQAIKSAPKGIVRIGVAKPLPCSSVVGGDKNNERSCSSQECINSMTSDDHTGFDSFHECLQEYQEGLEVVQICLEPEDPSLRDDEVSAFEDLSMDECRKESKSKNKIDCMTESLMGDKNSNIILNLDNIENRAKNINGGFMNGNEITLHMKASKSEESLDEREDDDMTITEDDLEEAPRDLPDKRRYKDTRSSSADRKLTNFDENKRLSSNEQSKDISTSDEMVFAVTPTGLERISFEKYWKECDPKNTIKEDQKKLVNIEKVKSDESWKESVMFTASDNTPECSDLTAEKSFKLSVQDNNSLLYIDHECDGYETCLDEDSLSVRQDDTKQIIQSGKPLNGFLGKPQISDVTVNYDSTLSKTQSEATLIDKNNQTNKDNNKTTILKNVPSVPEFPQYPHVQEHIITQMKSLRIEPLNINLGTKKIKKKSQPKPATPKVIKRQCVEYYNDQAECLEEYKRQKKLEEEIRLQKEEEAKRLQSNRTTLAKKLLLRKQEPSEESTDVETIYPVPGCHKCFLENYAYALTKAFIAEASACKFCEVVREMLEPPKRMPERCLSAPAILVIDQGFLSETDDDGDHLLVPVSKDRRKSAGPLRFLPPRRESGAGGAGMTVSAAGQRWGAARRVRVRRRPGHTSLGISIVGGKVDIVSNRGSDDANEKGIFGIFIKNVVPDSPAGQSGELQTGDRILEVNGVCVRNAPHETAVQLIKSAGDEVVLTVQSLLAWHTDSSDLDSQDQGEDSSAPAEFPSPTPSVKKQKATVSPGSVHQSPEIKITVTNDDDAIKAASGNGEIKGEDKSPKDEDKASIETVKPKVVYSDDEESDDEDEEEDRRDLEGRTYTDKGMEIDRASAGAIKRTKEEKEADPEEEDEFGYTSSECKEFLISVLNFIAYLFHVYIYTYLTDIS